MSCSHMKDKEDSTCMHQGPGFRARLPIFGTVVSLSYFFVMISSWIRRPSSTAFPASKSPCYQGGLNPTLFKVSSKINGNKKYF